MFNVIRVPAQGTKKRQFSVSIAVIRIRGCVCEPNKIYPASLFPFLSVGEKCERVRRQGMLIERRLSDKRRRAE